MDLENLISELFKIIKQTFCNHDYKYKETKCIYKKTYQYCLKCDKYKFWK